MPAIEPILAHVGPFLLVLFRLGGLLVFAPVLGSPMVPARARVLLAAMLALALYPTLPPEQQGAQAGGLDLFTMAAAVAGESMVGLTIGLIAALPMYAVQLGGQVMGQQAGMGLAGIYNPALDVDADVIGQMLLFIALTVFAAVGGLDHLFLAAASTFQRIPVGGAFGAAAPLELFVGVVASGFEIALRVSAPVLCIILLETIATALLMKTMPQLNIMSIGFALKVLVTLVVLAWAVGAIGEAITDDVLGALRLVLDWAAGPGAAATPPTR